MALTKFIKEKDVLEQWPLSKATLIRARKRGLQFYRIGAYVCYRPEDLEAYFCKPRSWRAADSNERRSNKNGSR